MRLIDADKLEIEMDDKVTLHELSRREHDMIVDAVKYAPTVDAAPVKHGKWTTKRTQKHDGEWYCTVCDYEPIVMSDDMKYCPGCGAKMDLEG